MATKGHVTAKLPTQPKLVCNVPSLTCTCGFYVFPNKMSINESEATFTELVLASNCKNFNKTTIARTPFISTVSNTC